ncbi:MAG: rod shape-determining protein MreC [Lachnospiraceae bacterium]|nr:rod shape-determining protein MreC [Lachnospiraceae bacterium]
MSPIIKKTGGEKFTLPGKYLLFILSLVAVALIMITSATDIMNSRAFTSLESALYPFQRGLANAGAWLIRRKIEIGNIRSLQAENEELKRQIDALTTENIYLQQDEYELTNLRRLYELDAQYQNFEKTGARIIAKDGSNWYQSFIIDKGTDDGIAVDMNVIAGSGLVGRVNAVGSNWARVQSIISDNAAVSGTLLSSSDNLIVTGSLELYKNGRIAWSKLVDPTDRVAIGDKIVTSNISDKFLPGILIGYVSDIKPDANNLTKSGELIPAASFEHLDEVLVILTMKQELSEESTGIEDEEEAP